jgi:hypothetical protein
MHQIKNQLSHPNLHCHHIQGDVLKSIAKTIHQSPLPILSTKSSLTLALLAMNMLALLLESQSQSTLTLQTPPPKQLTLKEFAFASVTLLY